MTSSKLLPSLTAIAAAAALVPATASLAADAPTTVPGVEITKAYAYVDTSYPDGKDYAAVVVRTKGELPRRADGMIRAGGSLDGVMHSLGSVKGAHGKARNCYMFLAEIKDGKIRGADTSARKGTKHKVVIAARGTEGDIKDSVSVKLRAMKAGDRSGKPLGC